MYKDRKSGAEEHRWGSRHPQPDDRTGTDRYYQRVRDREISPMDGEREKLYDERVRPELDKLDQLLKDLGYGYNLVIALDEGRYVSWHNPSETHPRITNAYRVGYLGWTAFPMGAEGIVDTSGSIRSGSEGAQEANQLQAQGGERGVGGGEAPDEVRVADPEKPAVQGDG